MVLHTWTRELRHHPHVHAIVTAGGLSLKAERWISSSSKYLFPVQLMGALRISPMASWSSRSRATS